MAELESVGPNLAGGVPAAAAAAGEAVQTAPGPLLAGPSASSAPAVEPAPVEPAPVELTPEQRQDLSLAIEGINHIAQAVNRSIRFQVFDDLQRMFAQVVDSDSGEVLKTIPPLELLEALSRIDEAIGLLVDEKG